MRHKNGTPKNSVNPFVLGHTGLYYTSGDTKTTHRGVAIHLINIILYSYYNVIT